MAASVLSWSSHCTFASLLKSRLAAGQAPAERLEHRVHRGHAVAKVLVPKEVLHQSPQPWPLRLADHGHQRLRSDLREAIKHLRFDRGEHLAQEQEVANRADRPCRSRRPDGNIE